MGEYSQKDSSHLEDVPDMCCEHDKHSILAFNIYDQCKQKTCDNYGPSISEEPCECIILENFNYPCEFGRFIFPGRPIILPEQVVKVKIVNDSFKIKTVGVMVTKPSRVKKGYWDIEVHIKYEFKLRFYDCKMRPMEIKCLSMISSPEEPCCYIKDYICASICEVKTYTLYGGIEESTVVATEFFCDNDYGGWPHAMVKMKAYPFDATIICVNDLNCCQDIYDGIYEETLRYVYITIGSYMMLFLYRIVSLLIATKGFSVPEDYAFPDLGTCEQFMQTDFGEDKHF